MSQNVEIVPIASTFRALCLAAAVVFAYVRYRLWSGEAYDAPDRSPNRKFRMKAIYNALAVLCFTLPTFAAHPFHVEDMQKLARVNGPKLSLDGKWVAFT